MLKTKVDGPLDQEIRQILRESVPGGVSNVMETFGCTDKARQASGETAIARASETILRQIRQGLRANQAAVDRTISARIAASVASPSRVEQDDSEEPIFASLQNAPVHSAIEEQKLYTGIARKALGKGVINIVNHFYRGIGCGVCQTKKKEERVVQLEDGEDEAYYSDYYYGAVNKRFQDKYHAVAGRAIFMEPSAAAQQQQQLQGLRGARLRKKLQDLPPRPKLEPLGAPVKPLGDQRPKLVPLGASVKPKLVPLVAPEPRVDLTKGVQRVNDGLPDFLDFLKKNKK